MLALVLILSPLLFAALAFLMPSGRLRPWLLPIVGLLHLGLTLVALLTPLGRVVVLSGWLVLDPLARLVLLLCSGLFCACSLYAPAYLRLRREDNRVFCASLILALSAMSLMILSHHLGLMWVAMEAITLATAPMLYFQRTHRSLEATWKYLLIGSVGVALALLGSFFLAYASLGTGPGGGESTLLFDDLVGVGPRLSRPWLHAAFVLLFVGYGTKMGLAPMHTWKPDAYGEAPGLVGALLSGGVTSCAFLAILRFFQICQAAGEGAYASRILVGAGLLSMAVAAVFVMRQRDMKRVLAYSSVEHMGILVLGIGIGGAGLFGSLLHLCNNALAKGVLFMGAGNIHRAYGSKLTTEVSGAFRRVPASATLLLCGLLAVTGSPPFGVFLSEFTILGATLSAGRFGVAGLYLLLLLVIFVGMAGTILSVLQGTPPPRPAPPAHPDPNGPRPYRETVLSTGPALVLLGLLTLLGVYIPGPLQNLLTEAAVTLEAPARPGESGPPQRGVPDNDSAAEDWP